VARKKVKALIVQNGKTEVVEREGIKFEMFIFDVIPRAERSLFYETLREMEFSPLKNKSGVDSIETCIRGQIERDARLLESCGVRVPRDENGQSLHRIEISPLFASDLRTLRKRLADEVVEINGDRLFA
jgi:UDP-N-acetylglucosamine/UDP-N-acetylgalactosamine diphosphorylase